MSQSSLSTPRLLAEFLGTALLLATVVAAQPISVSGDIVLVQDPTGAITNLVGMNNQAIFPSHQEQFCRAAFNAARGAGLAGAGAAAGGDAGGGSEKSRSRCSPSRGSAAATRSRSSENAAAVS